RKLSVEFFVNLQNGRLRLTTAQGPIGIWSPVRLLRCFARRWSGRCTARRTSLTGCATFASGATTRAAATTAATATRCWSWRRLAWDLCIVEPLRFGEYVFERFAINVQFGFERRRIIDESVTGNVPGRIHLLGLLHRCNPFARKGGTHRREDAVQI